MKQKTSAILKVGVTGGIGSGKSTVCRIFERFGVQVLYADDIAKEISVRLPELRRKIIALLGSSAYTADGSLDREFIAGKIFSDRNLQKRLDGIVHPEVEKEIGRQFDELEKRKVPVVVVEAALIYESGFDKRLDTVIVVDSTEEKRLERLGGADQRKRAEIKKRMKAQWNPALKLKKADFVILNNGTLEQLQEKVKFLHEILNRLATN